MTKYPKALEWFIEYPELIITEVLDCNEDYKFIEHFDNYIRRVCVHEQIERFMEELEGRQLVLDLNYNHSKTGIAIVQYGPFVALICADDFSECPERLLSWCTIDEHIRGEGVLATLATLIEEAKFIKVSMPDNPSRYEEQFSYE